MSAYILVLVIRAASGVAMEVAEFSSLQACEDAKTQWTALSHGFYVQREATCFKK